MLSINRAAEISNVSGVSSISAGCRGPGMSGEGFLQWPNAPAGHLPSYHRGTAATAAAADVSQAKAQDVRRCVESRQLANTVYQQSFNALESTGKFLFAEVGNGDGRPSSVPSGNSAASFSRVHSSSVAI